MKKRLLCTIVLVLAFMLVFTSCAPVAPVSSASPSQAAPPPSSQAPSPSQTVAPSPSQSAAASEAPSAKKTYTIIDAPKMVGIAWWDRAKEGDAKFAADTGNKVVQIGSTQADSAAQIGVWQDIIAQKPDVMCAAPLDPAACEPILKQARDAGIVVITQEGPGMQNIDYDIEAFNNAEYGAYLMDKLAELMGGKGEFVIMVGLLTTEAHMQRANGAVARWKEKYPDMKMATDICEGVSGGVDKSYDKMKELLSTYPNLGGVLGFDMVNPPGCALAVEDAGKTGKVKVMGTSLVSVCKQFLQSGSCQLINFWDPYQVARVMAAAGVLAKEGKKIETGMDLGVPGWEKIKVEGKVIYGQAWTDVTAQNMGDYNF